MMDNINRTLTTSIEQITYSNLPEPPYSENMNSKNTSVASVHLGKNQCRSYIFFLHIVLIVSTVITVTAVYICNSSKQHVPVGQQQSGAARYYNNISFDCSHTRSPKPDWYYLSPYNPGYACEPFKVVSSINIQSLQVRGHECNDTDHCYDLIRTYLGIIEGHSKFGFFIDNDSNIYGGRGWFCQFLKGQIWVGVMVEGFGAASQTDKERILHHFMEGIIPKETFCSMNVSDLQFNYFDGIVI